MSATLLADAFLRARLVDDAALSALVPGGVHESITPDDCASPFIVVDYPTESIDTTYLGGFRAKTLVLPTVRVVGRDVPVSDLAPAARRVDELLCLTVALELPGGRVHGCGRISEVRDSVKGADGIWRWLGGVYRISLTAS